MMNWVSTPIPLPPLPEPKPRWTCKKCGIDHFQPPHPNIRYHVIPRGSTRIDENGRLEVEKRRECLIKSCPTCGFSWEEPTADQKESAA